MLSEWLTLCASCFGIIWFQTRRLARFSSRRKFFPSIFLETLSRFQMLNSFESGRGGVLRAEGELVCVLVR